MSVDKYGRELYDILCSRCGKACSVPFKPDGVRNVYCMECLKFIRSGK